MFLRKLNNFAKLFGPFNKREKLIVRYLIKKKLYLADKSIIFSMTLPLEPLINISLVVLVNF